MSRLARFSPARLLASGAMASALTMGALLAPAATFASGGSPTVRAVGHCSARSTSALKAKHDNGRIEVEFQVDQNRVNRLWNVRIWDDGHRVFTGARRTTAPSGSFTVRRLITNRAGVDTLVALAVNPRTGETCRARLRV